jgi:hypothetical protein
MTVYVVTEGDYSDYRIKAIFSTKDAAEAYISEGSKYKYADFNDIDEWELDAEAGYIMRPYWGVYLTKDGSLSGDVRTGEQLADPNARSGEVGQCGDWGFQAESYVSEEHALKLAAEARQEWLRKSTENV